MTTDDRTNAGANGDGTNAATDTGVDVDVVVVGAGFSGMYMIHRLRQQQMSVLCLETADDVGGTWYWNRYPGARCDIPTIDYSYSFDPELEREWEWTEKYATQPEILAYAQHVADRYDLRRDIRFNTRIESAVWDESISIWRIRTDGGDEITCRFYVMATGCLSVPKDPDIEGVDRFAGEVYVTGRWPHEPVDFTGKRVAVVGTGSSGIQSIPLIAEQADQLYVFQRTPNFSVPAHNGPVPEDRLAPYLADRASYRAAARLSRGGIPREPNDVTAAMCTPEEQRERLETAWAAGGLFDITGVFADQVVNPASNQVVANFIHNKIREIVDDPATAELLCPTNHYFGTKRPCLDTNYYATFNRDNVSLIDLNATPITSITEAAVVTSEREFEVDAIVYATGFDAMTGAIVAVDITGRDGATLKQRWADGPLTYLGLMTVGFPNFFSITGPGSPSVLSNMMVSIEQHVDWIADALADLRSMGMTTIEPTPTAQAGWVQHVNDCADITLLPTANSWYMGANVPGKPRVFLPYAGGVDGYRLACDEVRERNYLGFELSGPGGSQCHDGVIRRVQPDVAMVLDMMAQLELPPIDSMSPEEARGFMEASAAMRPPGPEVGEIVDGTLPGPAGDLAYRLYRPASPGPHPVVVYFHGGGWVLGHATSDDPFCRDMCVRTDAIWISVDYRHAPEHRFPAPVDDAIAATRWVADHLAELGGIEGQLVLAGYSAGANLAAVVCQVARDDGGPNITAQLLLTPVTDSAMDTESFDENADGFILTASLMNWFWDHYADPADRSDVRLAPLRGELCGLPPAVITACEFDPLRDEGLAYADALAAAGVPVTKIFGRGHTHTSLTMVDVTISSAPVRAEMAQSLRALLDVAVST